MPRLTLITGDASAGPPSRGQSVIVHLVGARPDAVSLAPVVRALDVRGAFHQRVLHIGHRSDHLATRAIFAALGLHETAREIETELGTHARQTAKALEGAESVLAELEPTAVVVTGASDAALGCALAATKLGIPVARLEAGLREHDWRAPEEVNRVLMDKMADTLFCPTRDAAANLAAEGVPAGSRYVSGSTAVDALRRLEPVAVRRAAWKRYDLDLGGYVLVTLHRAANVDDDERLARIVEALAALARRVPVVFPMHPHTRGRLEPMGDAHRLLEAGVLCGPPLDYVDFLSVEAGAGAIVTDSGTVQDEASALGIDCYTLRASTERTATLTHGTNRLLGHDPRDIAEVRPATRARTPSAIPLWDGHASERVADGLIANYALVRAVGVS